MMNWGQAQAAATGFMHRRDTDWSMIQPFANDDISQALLVQEMEAAIDLATAAVPASPFYKTDLPIDFARARSVTNESGEMQPVPAKTLRARLCGPQAYSIFGGQLWCFFSGTVSVIYTQRLPAMSADSDTNEVLAGYAPVYLYALLKHGAAWSQDFDQQEKYQSLFDEAVGRANENYASAAFGAGMVPIPPGGIV